MIDIFDISIFFLLSASSLLSTQVRVLPTDNLVLLVIKANILQMPVPLVEIANRANFKNWPQQLSTAAKFVERGSIKTIQEVLNVNYVHLVKI